MKKFLIIVICATICLTFSSCIVKGMAFKLPLRQSPDNVVKIELFHDDDGRYDDKNGWDELIYTLSDDEINDFMESLIEIKCYKYYSPVGYYGNNIVQLYYENGDIEIIGSDTFGYISSGVLDPDGDFGGWYYIDNKEFLELFNEYAQ